MASEIEISKRLVLVNSISSVVARVLNVGVLVWLQQYLLDRISADEYSIYPVVMSIMVFVPLATSILTSGISRYAVEAKATGDTQRVTTIVSTMAPLLCAASIIILIVGSLFVWKIDEILTIADDRVDDARIMLGLLVVSTAIRLPLVPFSAGFFIRQKMVLANMIRVGAEFARIGILFWLLFGVSTRVIWVVVAAVISDSIRGLIMMRISHRLVPELRFSAASIRWNMARELVSFGAWRFVSQLADRLRSSADVIILNKLASPIDVTSYHIGSLPRKQLGDAIGQASMAILPPMTAMHAQGKSTDLKSVYIRGGRIALWISLIVALPAMVFHQEIIHLYLHGKYQGAGVVMVLLLAAFPIGYGHIMLPRLVTATAEIKPFAKRTVAAQIVNVLLTLCLVGYFKLGAMGSALSTLIVSAVLTPILIWPLGFKMANLRFSEWRKLTLWPGLSPALAGLLTWSGIRMWYTPETWLSLGLACVAGMIPYTLVLLIVAMRKDDRADLSRAVAMFRRWMRIAPNSPD